MSKNASPEQFMKIESRIPKKPAQVGDKGAVLERLKEHGGAYKHTKTTQRVVDTSQSVRDRSRDVLDGIYPNRDLDTEKSKIGRQVSVITAVGVTALASPQIVDGLQWMGEQIDKGDPANHIVIPIEVHQLPEDPTELVVHVN